jgi:hypothetical protein
MAQGSAIFLIAISLTVALYGCGEQRRSSAPVKGVETLTIEAFKEVCGRDIVQLCYVASTDGGHKRFLLSRPIHGLNFEWGKRQTVQVRVYTDQKLEVARVLERAQESYEQAFVLEMPARALREIENCLFAIGNEVKFTVSSNRVCRQARALMTNGGRKYFQFGYTGSSAIPIRLESVGSAEQAHSE